MFIDRFRRYTAFLSSEFLKEKKSPGTAGTDKNQIPWSRAAGCFWVYLNKAIQKPFSYDMGNKNVNCENVNLSAHVNVSLQMQRKRSIEYVIDSWL